MAEKTEITFGYLRNFRDEKIKHMLNDLRYQRDNLEDYVDEDVSREELAVNGIRSGNPKIFPAGGNFAYTLNNNVRLMRDQLNLLIKKFEDLDKGLELAELQFEKTEDDAVVTVKQLAFIIDPKNISSAGNPYGEGGD